MAKQTDRQKMEHYRQKVAKEYKDTIEELKADNKRLREIVNRLYSENDKLKKENTKLNTDLEAIKKLRSLNNSEIEALVSKATADKTINKAILDMYNHLKQHGVNI